jgi:hypothetical protein
MQEQFQFAVPHHENTVFDGERLWVEVGLADIVRFETQGKTMASCAGEGDGLDHDGIAEDLLLREG